MQFRHELTRLGGTATDDQLRRWRNGGLLPQARQDPRYKADGRVDGSETRQFIWAAKQAVAVERTIMHFRSFDQARAILWMAGYDVEDRYWRPCLERADEVFSLAIDTIRVFADTEDSDATLGDSVAHAQHPSGLLAKVARKIGRAELPRLFNLCSSIAAGDFSEFAPGISDEDVTDEQFAARSLGMHQGAAHQIGGVRLNLKASMEAMLAALSRSLSGYRLADFSDDEISAARDDVRNALKVGFCLFEATSWIYGPKAFGLQIAGVLTSFASQDFLAVLTVGFARLRRVSNELLTTDEIAALADEAEKAWLMSMRVKDLFAGDGALAALTPQRLNSALSDSASYENLLGKLASSELANREFRPWHQWQKSAGKTMSPGLLAMSIGSPEMIAFDDLVGNTNALAGL